MEPRVTERPILFSGPMVRAILAGTKTQTRRLVRPQPYRTDKGLSETWTSAAIDGEYLEDDVPLILHRDVGCPYGVPGDRLWVRETWTAAVAHMHGLDACDCGDLNVTFAADGSTRYVSDSAITAHEGATGRDWYLPKAAQAGKNVPAMFMPRFASRLTLEVTEVRVQRLQDITESDILAEGVNCAIAAERTGVPWSSLPTLHHAWAACWDSINAKRAPWDSNPWVWAVTFRRLG